MKKHLLRLALMAMVLCANSGCSTTTAHKLNELNLGMSQADVKSILGDDYVVAAATTDTNGARLQLWDYSDKKTQTEYRLYFKDGKLAQWGKKGDTNFPTLTLPSNN